MKMNVRVFDVRFIFMYNLSLVSEPYTYMNLHTLFVRNDKFMDEEKEKKERQRGRKRETVTKRAKYREYERVRERDRDR